MSRSRRILWSEGMFLTPHHFQQWDNYQDQSLDFRQKALTSFSWGLTELEIRREGIANGQITLARCSGLLPGGTPFSIPDSDDAPPTRSVEGHFEASARSLDVYLGVGLKRQGTSNVTMSGVEGARPARFRGDMMKVSDEVNGENEREVAVTQNNLKILFGSEALTDYETIKIAEIRRTGQGVLELHESYIPPCLRLSASGFLQSMTFRLLEILHAKCSS